MPPRDRFIVVPSLGEDIAGNNFERSLLNLGESLRGNRRIGVAERGLEESKRQFDTEAALDKLALDFENKQRADTKTFLKGQGVDIGEDVQLPDAILKNLASTVFKSKSDLAKTRAEQEGAVGFQEQVKSGRERLLSPLAGQADPRLDVPPELDPNFQPEPTPRTALTPEEDLKNFLDTKAAFIQGGGDPRAFESKSIIEQEKSLRAAVLDKRKQEQKRFAPPKITGQLTGAVQSFGGDITRAEDLARGRQLIFDEKLELAINRGVGVAQANRQAALESPMSQSDLKNIVRKDGSSFPFGTTPLEAIESGAVVLTPGMKEKLNKLEDVDTVLNTLLAPDEASGKILELFTSEDLLSRAKDVPRNLMAKFLDVNINDSAEVANFKGNLRSYENFRSTLPSLMVRSLGEVGTLTDRDIERAQSFFPPVFGGLGIPTSQSTAIQSVRDLRALITEIRNRKKGEFGVISDEKIIRRESDLPNEMRNTKQRVDSFISRFEGGIPKN